MELHAEEFNVEILHPAHGDNPVATRLEVRRDPLTGHTARVLPPSGLMVPQRYDLTATPGYVLNLRMVCRPNLEPFYRSDVAWLDRLHGEAAVDLAPEELADRAAGRFR